MASRLNRAIELLEQDQAIYYVGGHTGHVLTLRAGPGGRRTPGPTTSTSAWSMARST